MMTATVALSGKTHRDENFPVASKLMDARHRGPILAFYRFARAADDVADHPTLSAERKLALLEALGEALCGGARREPDAEPLRLALRERGLSPRHALDLLAAFRIDVHKRRYADWAELMDYCRLSAAPVGRFVLEVHGEDEARWPASDALCAALQVINHLQDCGADYRRLDRVYLPQDVLAAHGAATEALGAARASPALRGAIAELARRAGELTRQGAALARQIADHRLALEIGAIESLARRQARELERRDPLGERVRLGKVHFIWIGGVGALRRLPARLMRTRRTRPQVDA